MCCLFTTSLQTSSKNHVMTLVALSVCLSPLPSLPLHLGSAMPADTESLLSQQSVDRFNGSAIPVGFLWEHIIIITQNSPALQPAGRCCLRPGPYFSINKQCYPINTLLLTDKSQLWDTGNIRMLELKHPVRECSVISKNHGIYLFYSTLIINEAAKVP